MEKFREGRIWLLITTDLMARGMGQYIVCLGMYECMCANVLDVCTIRSDTVVHVHMCEYPCFCCHLRLSADF